jgi:hypothetical protein
MIKRSIWFVLGVTMGGWLVLRAKHLARRWAPRSVGDQAAHVGVAVRDFADDVRTAMTARESELRQVLGIADRTDDPYEKKDGR